MKNQLTFCRAGSLYKPTAYKIKVNNYTRGFFLSIVDRTRKTLFIAFYPKNVGLKMIPDDIFMKSLDNFNMWPVYLTRSEEPRPNVCRVELSQTKY